MGHRQVIIMRKDLEMSSGKLMAQASHASIAFIINEIRKNAYSCDSFGVAINKNDADEYRASLKFKPDLYEQWIDGAFTKTVCQAKNKNQLMKAKTIAEELGLKENEDFWLIKDNCYTELEPEEYDEHGVGRCLTCIGFKPLSDEIAHKISKKFHLYMD